MFAPFTDGPGSPRALLRGFGFSEAQIYALQELARALNQSSQPERARPTIRRTKVRSPLLDFLFPPRDKVQEAIAWIAALHAYKPAGLQRPRQWGLYSTAFVSTVRICFEAAGLLFPKAALSRYQQQAAEPQYQQQAAEQQVKRKREAMVAALRSTPAGRTKA